MTDTNWQPSTLSLAFVGSMVASGFVYPLSMGEGLVMAVPHAFINGLLAIGIVLACALANNAIRRMAVSNRGGNRE